MPRGPQADENGGLRRVLALAVAPEAENHLFVGDSGRNERGEVQNLLLWISIQNFRQAEQRGTSANTAVTVAVAFDDLLTVFTQVRILDFHCEFPLPLLGVPLPCSYHSPRRRGGARRLRKRRDYQRESQCRPVERLELRFAGG
jgi:hypothetical protein